MADFTEWDPRFIQAPGLNAAAAAPAMPAMLDDAQFSITKINYKPPHNIVHLVTANNNLVMALENSHIIRLDLDDPEQLEDIEIAKKPDQIRGLFLDPSGNHLIISTYEDNIYLHKSWTFKSGKRPRPLTKTKGVLIDAVGWDLENSDPVNGTGSMLVGSSNNLIYELAIDLKDASALIPRPERIWKQLYSLQGEGVTTVNNPNAKFGVGITGITFFRFPHQSNKFCIIATTASRIYQFVGLNSLELVFQSYLQHGLPDFQDFSGGSVPRPELCQYLGEKVPKSIAWLTGPGVYLAEIQLASQTAGQSVLQNTINIPFPSVTVPGTPNARGNTRMTEIEAAPSSIVLTEFHYVLLYSTGSLFAISRLTNEIVYEGRFPIRKDMLAFAHDPKLRVTFAFSADQVFEIHIDHEDRDVWAMYLQKGSFAEAERYCKEPWQKDKVWTAQAEYYFNQKQYDLAAKHYGKTSKSFEEITLRFIHIGESDALRAFLKEKLTHMNTKRDLMHITILCTWLTELYLNKLNQLEAEAQAAANGLQTPAGPTSGAPNASAASLQAFNASRANSEFDAVLEEFRKFLEEYSKLQVLDHATTFNLISSHGRTKELLHYASIVKDYDKVLSYHIQHEQFQQSLDVLVRLRDAKMFYKYCPVLMEKIPEKTVDALIALEGTNTGKDAALDPSLLIPALMRYKHDTKAAVNQAVRFLQYCVRDLKSKVPAIHNFLLSLYAQSDSDNALLEFIKSKDTYFDLEFALRLTQKHNKQRASVFIFSKMGLYEEAVDLALKINIELAKQIADMPPDDEVDIRKKLWLRIARHVVEDEKDITNAMKFLQSTDLLKIEDILPFFPDFVVIDDFKEEICLSLQEYNKHIEDLEHEMNEATQSAENIRRDIENLKNKYGFVSGSQTCEICKHPVLTRAFLLFPCQHVFHRTCLATEMGNQFQDWRAKRIGQLQSSIKAAKAVQGADGASAPLSTGPGPSSISPSSLAAAAFAGARELFDTASATATHLPATLAGASTLPPISSLVDQVSATDAANMQDELDKLVGSECLLCGEAMIKSITKPFVELDLDALNPAHQEARSWMIEKPIVNDPNATFQFKLQ